MQCVIVFNYEIALYKLQNCCNIIKRFMAIYSYQVHFKSVVVESAGNVDVLGVGYTRDFSDRIWINLLW